MAIQNETLESFFFEKIERAQERFGQPLSPDVEVYVVGLLSRFARRTHAAGRRSEPLALDYLRARDQCGSARATALRSVGDRALYISGVAPRSIQHSPVNIRYIQGIGEAAYREVADQSQWSGALAVLGELAEEFAGVSEVISDIVDLDANPGSGNDLLELYERWRKDGDPRDRRRLIEAGVWLGSGSDQVQ